MTAPEHRTAAVPADVEVEIADGLAHVRLDRPDKLNGVTLAMLEGLCAAAERIAAEASVRAVVLSGKGRSFSAGLDFATVMPDQEGVARAFEPRPGADTNIFQEACWAWRRLEVPVIAAVHGHCLGAGLQLALGADIRITAPDAQWSVLEAKWGLVPDMTGIRSLAELVGIDTAKLLTMTGRWISGQEAADLGLATLVSDDPVSAAGDLAADLSARSPDGLAAAKRLFERAWGASPAETFAAERAEQWRLLSLPNTAVAQRRAAGADAEEAPYQPRAPR